MPSPYLNDLIRIAKTDLPQLAHDLENASTIYAVQDAVKRLHNFVTYLIHHVVMSDPSVAAAAAAQAQAQPAPLPAPPPGYRYGRTANGQVFLVPVAPAAAQPVAYGSAPIGQAPAVDHYPSQHPANPTSLPLVSLVPAGAPIQIPGQGGSGPVVDVTITPKGSRVVTPGGETMLLPPGAPIDTTGGAGLPGIPTMHDPYQAQPPFTSRPQFTSPGIAPASAPTPAPVSGDVVLPEGGGMTPEVAAALSRRSNDQPMLDASGGARNITNE